MSHVRAQIRAAVVAAVDAIADLAGAVQVHPRGVPAVKQLPAAFVSTPEEANEIAITANERRLTLKVELLVNGDVEELDRLAVLVEIALSHETLGELVQEWHLVGTQIGTTKLQKQAIGSLLLTYEALYRTALTNPESSI